MVALEPPRLEIAVRCEDARAWRAVCAKDLRACARAAMRAGLRAAGRPLKGEVSVLLSDDAHVRALNKTYRGKDAPTNVLAFAPPTTSADWLLGDVVVARETVLREARARALSPLAHWRHLLVHGCLHLCGYDHQTAPDARQMESLEAQALAQLGTNELGTNELGTNKLGTEI